MTKSSSLDLFSHTSSFLINLDYIINGRSPTTMCVPCNSVKVVITLKIIKAEGC